MTRTGQKTGEKYENYDRWTACDIWNILFMVPRIKLIVIFNLLWSEFVETNATFRSAPTDLDQDL